MTDDKSRSYPLLPKLNKNLTVQLANQACWIRESQDFLNSLTESIDSGTEVANLAHIDSIPDVWARPLLFQMALYDEDNKIGFVSGLHKQVVGEWRSLLAMIALKDIKHLNLTAQEVSIDPLNGGTIEKVLDVLKPQEAILKDDEFGINPWSKLYIIYLDGRILAITSPTTLVATAADYENTFAGRLQEPWSSNGMFLTDPVGRLSDEEHFALYSWLDTMHEQIQQHGLNVSRGAVSGDESVIKGLLRMLAGYRRDVGQRCARLGIDTKVDFVDAGLELNSGIFRWLNYTAKAKAATSQSSAFKLKVSEERRVDKDILIVSPEMAKSFANTIGVHPAKLPVWAGISANDLTEEDLAYGAGRIGRTVLNGAEFRRPEELFTDKIVMLNKGVLDCSLSVSGLYDIEGYTPIVPLKAEILEYFTTREIADVLYIEQKGDNVYVTFTYHLVQGDYKYTKVYETNDMAFITSTDPPVIEIWPNIKRDGWQKYYLYYENYAAQNTDDKLGLSFYVNPWSYEKQLQVPQGGLLNQYTARLDTFPEALRCQANSKEDGLVEAGIVLMKQPSAFSRSAGKKWNVGIDFGTSSTMVYYRENEEPPKPFPFTSNAYHITKSDLGLTGAGVNFIPCWEGSENSNESRLAVKFANLPDGSTISAYSPDEDKSILGEIKPLEEGRIAWITTEASLGYYKSYNKNIDLNLKWQNDNRGLYEIAAYLKQLCMHITAEAVYNAVDKISWNFSYPTAFSQTQKISFEGICREAVEDAVQNTGFDDSNALSITSWAESKAAAYHFNKVDNSYYNFSEGAICLDIGAGTTDISIISGAPGRIVYHTSMQYAGRYFFKPIACRMTLFGGESDLDINGNGSSYANATFDARMRDHSVDFLRDLKNLIGKDEVKAVLQQSQMAVGGLFYYLGELLAALKEKGIYAEERLPDVYIGGNGSRIFSWLTGGRFEDSNNYLSIIKNIFEKKSGLRRDAAFRIYLSEKPKIEVVAGMIGDKPTNDREFFDEDRIAAALFGEEYDPRRAESVMAGNDFVCHDLPGYPDGFISAADISAGIKVSELDEINAFVHMFNKGKYIWHEPIKFANSDMAHLLKNVNGYYVAQKGLDPKDIYVEPIFIVAMKQLIDMQVGR